LLYCLIVAAIILVYVTVRPSVAKCADIVQADENGVLVKTKHLQTRASSESSLTSYGPGVASHDIVHLPNV
jgi:hypothetical protein